MRTKIALLFAVVLGILAVLGIQAYLSGEREKDKAGKTLVGITVARESLQANTILKAIHIDERLVDEAAVTSSHVLWEQVKPYVGRQLTRRVPAQRALLHEYFLTRPEAQQFEARKVDTEMRAITIGTDQIAGVANLITPDSRVDILCTFRVAARGPESAATVVTKVIARNVQILAVDNRTDVRIPVRGGRTRSAFDQGYSSVTVHVSPMEASLLVFAQQTGKITFALRNRGDTDYREVNDITLSEFDSLVAEASRQRKDRLERGPTSRPPP